MRLGFFLSRFMWYPGGCVITDKCSYLRSATRKWYARTYQMIGITGCWAGRFYSRIGPGPSTHLAENQLQPNIPLLIFRTAGHSGTQLHLMAIFNVSHVVLIESWFCGVPNVIRALFSYANLIKHDGALGKHKYAILNSDWMYIWLEMKSASNLCTQSGV